MHQMRVWVGPDGKRYRVSLYTEPFDPGFATIAFQDEDGWIGVTRLASGYDLVALGMADLERFLELARQA